MAREASKPQLIIVCGAARSGTTLLHQMVGGHPEFHGAQTEWFGWGYHRPQLARAAGVPAPDTPERMRRLITVGLTETSMKKTGADLDVALSLADAHPSDWDHFMLIIVETMRRTSGLDTVVVKTPGIESELLYLDGFFSRSGWETRWIYSVRHPFDAYLSFREVSARWRRALLSSDAVRWSGNWIDSANDALAAAATLPDDRFRIQRFEDLIADPQAACRRLCEWLEAPDGSDQMLLAQGRPSNTSFRDRPVEAKAGAVRDVAKRERVGLSAAEEDSLRIICAGRARAFGYDLGPLPSVADQPPFLKQTAAMSHLSISNYLRFWSRELPRRTIRASKTAYSYLTGRRTTTVLR